MITPRCSRCGSERYRDLGRARAQVPCRRHQVRCELVPGGVPGEITAGRAARFREPVTPAGAVEAARWELAAELTEDLRGTGARIRETRPKAAAAVAATGTSLTGLFGVGPVIAGRILAEVGDVARFATKDTFASYNGTAPAGRLLRRPDPPPPVPRREPADQPRGAHDGGHPDPLPNHPRPPVLRAETPRGQDPERSAAVPQAAAV